MADTMPATAFLTLIDARLAAALGPPPRWLYPDPVDILVLALLSARTEDEAALAAIRVLRVRFPHWDALADADPVVIERLIGRTTWPDQKTLHLQESLRALRAERGRLELDFLAGLPVPAASAWLQRLPGVGPKTAASVLLFSRLHMRALPVSTGHHRVVKRLRLISRRATAEAAHDPLLAILPEAWDPARIERHHWLVKRLGKDCCTDRQPRCWRCPVRDLCPSRGRIRPSPPHRIRQLDLPLLGPLRPDPAMGTGTGAAGTLARRRHRAVTAAGADEAVIASATLQQAAAEPSPQHVVPG